MTLRYNYWFICLSISHELFYEVKSLSLVSLGSLHYPASFASCRRAPPSPFLLSSGAGGGLRREVNDRRDEPNDGGRHRAEGDIKDYYTYYILLVTLI